MNPTLDDYRGVWTLAEIRDGKIHPVSYELLAWGRDLADRLDVELACVLLGYNIADQAGDLTARGADRVYVVDARELEFFNMDSCDKVLRALIEEHRPEIFLAPDTSAGRAVMPVIAAKLRTGLVSDCIGLDVDRSEGYLIQIRPLIRGQIIAAVTTESHRPQMATLRPGSIRPPAVDRERRGEVVRKEFPPELLAGRITHLCFLREQDGTQRKSAIFGIKDSDMVDELVEIMTELERRLSVCVREATSL